MSEADEWKSLSVTAIAAENASVAEYVAQIEERLQKAHNSSHWLNPETGYAECECCCGAALDYEAVRKERDAWKAQAERWHGIIDEATMAMQGTPSEATREALAQAHIAHQAALLERDEAKAQLSIIRDKEAHFAQFYDSEPK